MADLFVIFIRMLIFSNGSFFFVVTPKNRVCTILTCNSCYLISVMRRYKIPKFLFLLSDLCIEIYFRLFLLFNCKSAFKIQKLNQCMVGISSYSSDKKGIGVVQFRLSFYVLMLTAFPFPPFLDLSLKHAPNPLF